MKQIIYMSSLLIMISCNRIQNKIEQIGYQIKEVILKKTEKAFPKFDHDQPDTKNNKQRFKEFLKVPITPDVKNILCFDDAIGINADYMLSFNCNSTTSNKIINRLHLEIDNSDSGNGFAMQHDFYWWNKKRIKNLQKYSWTNGNNYFKYYWYDTKNEKAYYFDFDI